MKEILPPSAELICLPAAYLMTSYMMSGTGHESMAWAKEGGMADLITPMGVEVP